MNNRSHHRRPAVILAGSALATVLLMSLALARTPRAQGEDVHKKDGNCRACHTGDAEVLNKNPKAAATALLPNLDATCNRCHAAQGASHKVGMVGKKTVPELPLTEGKLTCATCHFMHGEGGGPDYLRVDNRRGKMCLSCHTMAELQR
jgi:predicted CXXCH cytochrome family protein